ncbi:hypothetical protein F4677DRAFT_402845 [Hypoxylon crocopeplum]|nr:hypothetical protein F4677DRAFT_402845 [Hypoxylon crocopeplum]
MPSGSVAGPSASCSPAPYGRACAGCSRAKCKCFYRSEGFTCERCHRLGKTCEPASAVRKRKAQTPPPLAQPPPQPLSTRLEEKLDDLVTLLRSQANEKQIPSQAQTSQPPQESTPETTLNDRGGSPLSTPAAQVPDIALDTTASVVHLLCPAGPRASSSPIPRDISAHQMPDRMAEERLDIFRRSFISTFPFVYIPATTSAAELRRQRPFLWLMIMSLTTQSASEQSAMQETIWTIISRRIVSQHLADLDLLLGLVCFATWSHYFKKEKPFTTMLAQLTVLLAFELGVHQDAPANPLRRSRLLPQQPARQAPRTLEERRTMLAVFHVTSATWSAYRKTEPLRWTPYMDDCLRLVSEGRETHLDMLLATQVKCQIITNQLTCPSPGEFMGGESSKAPSAVLVAALLGQLSDIRQNLPAQLESERATQLYLWHTELKIRESLLSRPRLPDQTGLSHFQRLQNLDSVLSCVERWRAVFLEMPLHDWLAITTDTFSQFTQCLVILFKLATLEEPGWDLEEVKRRADVFEILDRACEIISNGPTTSSILNAEAQPISLIPKTLHLFRTIKAMFLAEMPQNIPASAAAFPTPDSGLGGIDMNDAFDFMGDEVFADEFLLNMMHEDILTSAWDFRQDNSYIPFDT